MLSSWCPHIWHAQAFEKASGINVPYKLADRRPGDAEAVWAGTEKSEQELGWKATRTVDDMCRDLWQWIKLNPKAYDTPLEEALKAMNEQ